MKDEEKNAKKSSKKLIIVIAVIIVIAAIAFGFYQGIFSLPTGLAVGGTSATGNQNSANENSASPQSSAQQPTFTTTGTEVTSKEVTEDLPYYESVGVEPGIYIIEFTSDKPVFLFVYDELHFNEWKSGRHPSIRAGTSCCKEENKITSYTDTFKFAQGEGNSAYIVVEGADKASIKFKITQTLRFK